MAVKRVGDKISFYYDDRKLNEQPIDPDVNLHLWFDPLFCTAKIKSVKLTAEKLCDERKTVFNANDPAKAKPPIFATHPVAVQAPWWKPRHDGNVARMNEGDCDLLMIGDSITHGFDSGGKAVWDKHYAPRKAMNLGFSGDRTQHVLWRLDHLPTEKISPKAAVLMIGTNNVSKNTAAEEIALGIKEIVLRLGKAWPKMNIVVLYVFPREAQPDGRLRQKVAAVNALLPKTLEGIENVKLVDINEQFLDEKGVLSAEIMPDGLHPNAKGYEIWGKALEPELEKIFAKKK
jgi:lysophospholipase L1-like esterase